ncbi:RNA-binding protein [Trifolium repens]|nr:RNA-binding protein [Trifolium repens]
MQQQQWRRGQFVVNGYFVYTRRKRIEHDSDNEKAKRLKTEGKEQVKVKIDEAVNNDVVLLWTSKRKRRPSFKDGSGDKVAAARVVNNEEERCVCSMVLLLFTSVARRRNSVYDVINSVTPNIRWLRVGPQDAMTDNIPDNMLLPMTQWDINMAMRLLNKEFVQENIEWVEAINMMKLLAKLEDDDMKRVDETKEDAADQISRPGTETIPLPQLVSSALYVEGIPSDWTIRKVADVFCRFVGYRKVRLEVINESMDQVGDPSVVGIVDPFCASIAMSVLEGITSFYLLI